MPQHICRSPVLPPHASYLGYPSLLLAWGPEVDDGGVEGHAGPPDHPAANILVTPGLNERFGANSELNYSWVKVRVRARVRLRVRVRLTLRVRTG